MSLVRTRPDNAYWDEKATELAYLSALHTSGVAAAPHLNHKTLHERAIATVGTVNFDELMINLGVDTAYTSLTRSQTATAVGMGILGVLTANYTNGKSKELTEFLKKYTEITRIKIPAARSTIEPVGIIVTFLDMMAIYGNAYLRATHTVAILSAGSIFILSYLRKCKRHSLIQAILALILRQFCILQPITSATSLRKTGSPTI
jgi:hypothetical protein